MQGRSCWPWCWLRAVAAVRCTAWKRAAPSTTLRFFGGRPSPRRPCTTRPRDVASTASTTLARGGSSRPVRSGRPRGWASRAALGTVRRPPGVSGGTLALCRDAGPPLAGALGREQGHTAGPPAMRPVPPLRGYRAVPIWGTPEDGHASDTSLQTPL